ncbi:protein FAM53A isoform X1 [Alligator mississippiensis]|uniref:Protein FAM53A isoform B n=1 Tax=Alligator mississippiensis TaxID=8496 RepID=A0A151P9C7_ALLMI|nr:protein FAM53A isoform X1 [Alligator mississippiensis]XP_019334158.1 protein FAM53A isoform X1 [Alligator mississippiensis]XP_019334163.1 protein FAM53A isoform X1 [Alligator mississippiensis]XP_059577460.1 protein FAM53A isoform X1 [Alligator mississippiensis]KYO45633.1 protein FAM53A isoform B [Alligator mississippiensis]
MLVSVSSGKGTTTMVTLITEKLQNQSLDDLTCKTYNINLYSSEKLNKSGSLFPFEINEESPWKALNGGCPIRAEVTKHSAYPFPVCPFSTTTTNVGLQWQQESSSTSMVSGWISELNLNENSGQPLAPPTKRHCRSLSEPDELARCRSPWKPGSSKVWTPVSKRRCNSGGSATLQRCNSHGSATLQRSTSISLPQNVLSLNNVFTITSFNTSPVPRPSSASSGFVDSSEGSTSSSTRWNSGGPCDFNPRRRLSLSQEHITETGNLLPSANSTPTSTPELSRRQGLLRCRSQPCVLNEKKSRLKRRREEDVRWNRPSLDFFKMTRTLKNSKSLCSLDYEEDDDDDDDDTQMKTIVSSPCDSNDLMNIITPGSSPMKEKLDEVRHHGQCQVGFNTRDYKKAAAVCESDEDTSDCESTEEGIFPLDCGDLDLEQIENN